MMLYNWPGPAFFILYLQLLYLSWVSSCTHKTYIRFHPHRHRVAFYQVGKRPLPYQNRQVIDSPQRECLVQSSTSKTCGLSSHSQNQWSCLFHPKPFVRFLCRAGKTHPLKPGCSAPVLLWYLFGPYTLENFNPAQSRSNTTWEAFTCRSLNTHDSMVSIVQWYHDRHCTPKGYHRKS